MGLREQLRVMAEQAPTYEVYEATVRLARRRRRYRIGAYVTSVVLAGLLTVVGLTSAGSLFHSKLQTGSETGESPSLPDRVGLPYLGTARATDAPAGPASVLLGGDGWPFNLTSDLAVVGAAEDSYRTVATAWLHQAGEDALLSPDGGKVALPGTDDDPPLRLVDLRTGEVSRLSVNEPGSLRPNPLCWSPDGRSLVVGIGAENGQRRIAVMDLNGHYTQLPLSSSEPSSPMTHFVAFAPDGRLAYLNGHRVIVLDRDLHQIASWGATGNNVDWLAGKGAWSPDGTMLYELKNVGPASPTTWLFSPRNPLTGEPANGHVYTVEHAHSVRLVGWTSDRRAVMVRYLADQTVIGRAPQLGVDWGQANVVQLISVSPDGDTRVLVTTEDGIDSIDVATDLLSAGAVREGHPPGIGPYTFGLMIGVPLLIAWLVIRKVRRACGRSAWRFRD